MGRPRGSTACISRQAWLTSLLATYKHGDATYGSARAFKRGGAAGAGRAGIAQVNPNGGPHALACAERGRDRRLASLRGRAPRAALRAARLPHHRAHAFA